MSSNEAEITAAFTELPALLRADPSLIARGRRVNAVCLLGSKDHPFHVSFAAGQIVNMAPGVQAGLTFSLTRTAFGYESPVSAAKLISERMELLATHAHYDHAGAMAAIKKMTGARFMIEEKDAPVMADGGNSLRAMEPSFSSPVAGAFCKLKSTWNKGVRPRSRARPNDSTIFSKGTSWCS